MRLIVDAAPIVAQAERQHANRESARRVLVTESDVPVLSPVVAAEIDYFLQRRAGPGGNRPFLRDLAAGRYEVACLEPSDYQTIVMLDERYRDLSPGLADLSIVVLAARYRTNRILTFDQRHFRRIEPLQGGAFTLLPFDDPVT